MTTAKDADLIHGVILDTSVLINLMRGSEEHRRTVRDLVQQKFVLAVSSINIAELYAGLRRGEEQSTENLLAAVRHLDLTPKIAQMAGEMVASRRRAGKTHTLDDMMIAATAIEHGCMLMTDNRKDFVVPGLTLFPTD